MIKPLSKDSVENFKTGPQYILLNVEEDIHLFTYKLTEVNISFSVLKKSSNYPEITKEHFFKIQRRT
jgi:hypothetical protein